MTSCTESSRSFYTEQEFHQLFVTSEYTPLDTIRRKKSEIFEIYQDMGALGGSKFHVLHKKGSSRYHIILYPDTEENITKLEKTLE